MLCVPPVVCRCVRTHQERCLLYVGLLGRQRQVLGWVRDPSGTVCLRRMAVSRAPLRERSSRLRLIRDWISEVCKHVLTISHNLVESTVDVARSCLHFNRTQMPFLIRAIGNCLPVARDVKNCWIKRLARSWRRNWTEPWFTLAKREQISHVDINVHT
jgi:hypothetical protein